MTENKAQKDKMFDKFFLTFQGEFDIRLRMTFIFNTHRKEILYICYDVEPERGDKTGNLHYHAVVVTTIRHRLQFIIHIFQCHAEFIKAQSIYRALHYIKKQVQTAELGAISNPKLLMPDGDIGPHTTIQDVCAPAVKRDLKWIADNYHSIPEALQDKDNITIVNHNQEVLQQFWIANREIPFVILDKVCIWISGPTGCGKTRGVMNLVMNLHAINISTFSPYCTGKWINTNYQGEPIYFIDDFRKEVLTFQEALTNFDIYVHNYEQKGSNVQVYNTCQVAIITCSMTLEECFSYNDPNSGERRVYDKIDQLQRRFQIRLRWNDTLKIFDWTAPEHINLLKFKLLMEKFIGDSDPKRVEEIWKMPNFSHSPLHE